MKKTLKPIKLLLLNSCLKTGRLLIICLFLFKNNTSQNLINNGNFESYSVNANGCAFNFPMVNIWQQINSPDHFASSCTFTNNYGVPDNIFGCSYPVNGNAYAGIYIYIKNFEGKEYIYQQLTTPLVQNNVYFLSFFASRADRTPYAIKTLGAYFSVTQPTVASGGVCLLATPQVENHSGFLTDTIGWTKIEGYFKAQGGEQYITIGNFNSNANTDTLVIQSTNPLTGTGNEYAYYYIDSVSLYDSLDYVTNIKDESNKLEGIRVYPNPTKSSLTLALPPAGRGTEPKQCVVKISDMLGREIKQMEYDTSTSSAIEQEIDISDLENGIYFLSLYQHEKLFVTKKIIKQ